jgi:hypothetical protein
VVLVDSLEKLRGATYEEAVAVYDSVQHLFVTYVKALRLPLIHAVYTVPPYLPSLVPNLTGIYTTGALCHPCIHVHHRDGSDDEAGLRVMREIVGRRYAGWGKFLSEAQLNRLARSSGGDIRDFLRLIRSVVTLGSHPSKGSFPVDDATIELALAQARNAMTLLLANDVLILRAVEQNHSLPQLSTGEVRDLARLQDTHLVIPYRNGDDWWDIHPLMKGRLPALAPLSPPTAPTPPAS